MRISFLQSSRYFAKKHLFSCPKLFSNIKHNPHWIYWLEAMHWWDQLCISWEHRAIICITHDKQRWISPNKLIINDNCNNQEQSVDHITWRVCPSETSNHDKLKDDKSPGFYSNKKAKTKLPILSAEVEYWQKHYRWTNFLCLVLWNWILPFEATQFYICDLQLHTEASSPFFRLPLSLRLCIISTSCRQILYLSNQSEIGPLLSHPVWYLAQTLRV